MPAAEAEPEPEAGMAQEVAEEEAELDMAAAMGFASFGSNTRAHGPKRRKIDGDGSNPYKLSKTNHGNGRDDGNDRKGTGANTMALGARKPQQTGRVTAIEEVVGRDGGVIPSGHTTGQPASLPPKPPISAIGPVYDEWDSDAESLAQQVQKREIGDAVVSMLPGPNASSTTHHDGPPDRFHREQQQPQRYPDYDLNALSRGVRIPPFGDMAYFLPNFVEDPWARFELKGKGPGESGGKNAEAAGAGVVQDEG